MTNAFGLNLPDYPWDRLTEYRNRADEHPDGVCDLSIGTPVDPTPEVIRRALSDAGDAHGYPTTAGPGPGGSVEVMAESPGASGT